MSQEDPDIAIINARKMKELRDKAAALEKAKKREEQQQITPPKETDREIISNYLYDRGEEVLKLAESQYPFQTKAILARIIELIKTGEISQRISGGELLALFRSIGLKIRVNTSIKIEDHGKLVSLSDRLKQHNEDMMDNSNL
ncbi:MAG: DNA-binding protein [Nitrososphaeraceae archaeon]